MGDDVRWKNVTWGSVREQTIEKSMLQKYTLVPEPAESPFMAVNQGIEHC